MLRRHATGLALLALLLLVSIAIKLTHGIIASEPDMPRLHTDLISALERGGYAARRGRGNWWGSGLITASRGTCTIGLRDATLYGSDFETVTSRRMNGGRPIRYMRGGSYIDEYPRVRAEIAWRLQRELHRIGWVYGIDPVIAVAARTGCWPDPQLLEGVQFHFQRQPTD
jgi:hypothetical protein